jgi:UDP-N-acetylmuramate--alanine ligase
MTRRTTSYGFASQADLCATQVHTENGGTRFSVRHRGTSLGSVKLPLAGRHNVQNALATLVVALELEVPFETAAAALESFGGIERRFERKGEIAGVRVIDDYGHHPAEIRATLAAARDVHAGRIVVAFQPHRYTRTRDLWDEFVGAFNDADVLVLTEIYAAGEDKIPGIEAAPLAEAVRAHGHRDVHFAPDLERVLGRLLELVVPGDLVVTLGAGSISTLGARLLAGLAERKP